VNDTGEATRLRDEIARLTEAIAAGGPLGALLDALKQREGRRADVLAQLEHLDGMAKAPAWGDRPATSFAPRSRSGAPARTAAGDRTPDRAQVADRPTDANAAS